MQWDDALGFSDERFLGGAAGIGFGRYIDLNGFYLKSDNNSTNISTLPFEDADGAPLPDQDVDVASYGGEMMIGLGGGKFVPTIMGGGGLLRFTPDAGDQLKRIQLKYGLGFRSYLSETIEAEVLLERNQYYLDALDLAVPVAEGQPALPTDPDAGSIRRNLAIRIGLGIQLGSREFARGSELDRAVQERYQRPFSDLALTVQPFGGRQSFDAALDIESQSIAGLRAGLDFGSFVGMRGFYWRGVNGDYDGWERVKGYGAEAQFNLGDGVGVAPHLIAGGGKLEFTPDFDSVATQIPADQTALILGAGMDFNFGSRLRLTAAARDYILSGSDFQNAGVDLGNVRDPGDLVHNWQITAGLKVLVGGGRGIRFEPPPVLSPIPEVSPEFQPQAPVDAAPQPGPAPVQAVAPTSAGMNRADRDAIDRAVERIEAAALRAEEAAARANESAQAARNAQAADSTKPPVAPQAPTYPFMGPAFNPMYSSPSVIIIPIGIPGASWLPGATAVPAPAPAAPAPVPNAPAPAAPAAATPANANEGVTPEQMVEIVRGELERARTSDTANTPQRQVEPAPEVAPPPSVTPDDLRQMEERLTQALGAQLARERRVTEELVREEAASAVQRRTRNLQPTPQRDPFPVEPYEEEAIDATAPAAREPRAARSSRLRLDPELGFPIRELRPYTGLGFGQGAQWVLGITKNWGPFESADQFDIVPEFSVAFGEGRPTWMAAGNLQYRLPWLFERDTFWISPVASLGLGILNRDGFEAVLNATYGANIQLSKIRGRRGQPLNLFVGHQGIDLFQQGGLIVGVSLDR